MAEPELSEQRNQQKSSAGLRADIADKFASFSGSVPARWRFRLRICAWALLVIAAFIGYAGYSKQSVDKAAGKTSFVDSPGFVRFAESSGIAGLVDISAGMWRGLLSKAAPVEASGKEEVVDLMSEDIESEVVALPAGKSGVGADEITEEAIKAAEAEAAAATAAAEAAAAAVEAAAAAAAAAASAAQGDLSSLTPPTTNGECPKIPDIAWWENKTHEQAILYVADNYNGDWSSYIAKWESHLNKVVDVFVSGKKAMIKTTGKVLGENDLANYVKQIEERISVLRCLAGHAAAGKSPS